MNATADPKLYLLTNDEEFTLLYQKLSIALATQTIGLLQIRRKQVIAAPGGQDTLFDEAAKTVALAQRHQVPVVINDDIALAARLGVGVHLGQSDGSVVDARHQLAPGQLIGRTCHDDIDLVHQAQLDGADYAAMGAVFASSTKPNAKTVSYETLKKGCRQHFDKTGDSGIDMCVIGGLSTDNVRQLQGLPIGYVAVVGDIMNAPLDEVAARCHHWHHALSDWYLPR